MLRQLSVAISQVQVKSDQLTIDITLLGTVERGRAIRRDGARVGDVLCVTGSLGDSAGGLYTLLHPDPACPQEKPGSAYKQFIGHLDQELRKDGFSTSWDPKS